MFLYATNTLIKQTCEKRGSDASVHKVEQRGGCAAVHGYLAGVGGGAW